MTGKPSPPMITASAIGQADPRVGGEADQVVAEQGEARVVERRDGVEHPEPQRLGHGSSYAVANRTVRITAVTASTVRLMSATPSSTERDVAEA